MYAPVRGGHRGGGRGGGRGGRRGGGGRGGCLLAGVDSLCCVGLIESRSHQGAAGRSEKENYVRRIDICE